MRMANMTNRPICIKGARALKMDFKTTWRPRGKKIILKFVGLCGIQVPGQILEYWIGQFYGTPNFCQLFCIYNFKIWLSLTNLFFKVIKSSNVNQSNSTIAKMFKVSYIQSNFNSITIFLKLVCLICKAVVPNLLLYNIEDW